MFEIGSALPSRELVLAMEKIGRIVNGQKGNVVIQGHTDARPFRSATYDNWRLSTARAHSAYYMLVRGGVDERRITEVAGFADREPKDKADPFAAANRRIEILLETDG
jgi:chemotaxis protein MotB